MNGAVERAMAKRASLDRMARTMDRLPEVQRRKVEKLLKEKLDEFNLALRDRRLRESLEAAPRQTLEDIAADMSTAWSRVRKRLETV